MKIIAVFTLFAMTLLSVDSSAQLLKKLKDKVTDKAKGTIDDAKSEAKNKAKEAAKKELDDFNNAFDSTDVDYAILLSDNSGMFGGKGRNEFGVKFRQFGGIANSFMKDASLTDEENAKLNLQLGQSAYAMGRFVYAEKKLGIAKGYFEKASLTNDAGYIKTISSEGLLYTSMGRYEQAGRYTVQALDLRKEKLGANSMAVAASFNNYAVLQYDLGQYNESEKQFENALLVIAANKQSTKMPYAIVINNKAMLYRSLGRYDAAVKLLQTAIDMTTKGEIGKATSSPKFFSNLALLYQQMGKYADAEKIYQLLETRLDKNSATYASMLNDLAILYLLMKNDDKVESMLKRSAEIYKASMGESSPAYAKVISDLGNFYRYKGRYDEAEPLLQQALDTRKQLLGNVHPLFVQSQEDLAILLWKKKDMAKAYTLYDDVMQKTLEFVNRYFPPMSEAEKTKYWDLLSPRFQRFYNFAVDASATNRSALTDLFEYRIATKGLLLSSTRRISDAIKASGDADLIFDYNDWIDHKEQLTVMYAYSKDELKEQGTDLDSLVSVVNKMEKKLSEDSKDFANFFFAGKTKYSQVQKELKNDEALIEVIRLQNFDQVLTDDCRYLGLIATKGSDQPKLVILNEGNDMDIKYSKIYRMSMKNKISDERSYGVYWAPFDAEVKGKKTVYLSLDGVYTQLNLNTFKKPAGDFLIKQYDLVLLSNPRDIMEKGSKGKTVPGKKATLIGFPDYGKGNIAQLPGTKVEVDGINKLLGSSGYQVSEFIQKDATETNLKLAKKVSILHIATHGYFLQDVEKASWPLGVSADNAKDNVLLRSGLMLTGASDADKLGVGLDSSNNGIMTSYEAMNLDLSGTSLVVLSACETGLGEVKAGEGVYGLQRAFLVAGADAIIMSLWKVDDAATQQLMDIFYDKWIKSGDKQAAFKQAQLELMAKYKEPLYWGAFVMMED